MNWKLSTLSWVFFSVIFSGLAWSDGTNLNKNILGPTNNLWKAALASSESIGKPTASTPVSALPIPYKEEKGWKAPVQGCRSYTAHFKSLLRDYITNVSLRDRGFLGADQQVEDCVAWISEVLIEQGSKESKNTFKNRKSESCSDWLEIKNPLKSRSDDEKYAIIHPDNVDEAAVQLSKQGTYIDHLHRINQCSAEFPLEMAELATGIQNYWNIRYLSKKDERGNTSNLFEWVTARERSVKGQAFDLVYNVASLYGYGGVAGARIGVLGASANMYNTARLYGKLGIGSTLTYEGIKRLDLLEQAIHVPNPPAYYLSLGSVSEEGMLAIAQKKKDYEERFSQIMGLGYGSMASAATLAYLVGDGAVVLGGAGSLASLGASVVVGGLVHVAASKTHSYLLNESRVSGVKRNLFKSVFEFEAAEKAMSDFSKIKPADSQTPERTRKMLREGPAIAQARLLEASKKLLTAAIYFEIMTHLPVVEMMKDFEIKNDEWNTKSKSIREEYLQGAKQVMNQISAVLDASNFGSPSKWITFLKKLPTTPQFTEKKKNELIQKAAQINQAYLKQKADLEVEKELEKSNANELLKSHYKNQMITEQNELKVITLIERLAVGEEQKFFNPLRIDKEIIDDSNTPLGPPTLDEQLSQKFQTPGFDLSLSDLKNHISKWSALDQTIAHQFIDRFIKEAEAVPTGRVLLNKGSNYFLKFLNREKDDIRKRLKEDLIAENLADESEVVLLQVQALMDSSQYPAVTKNASRAITSRLVLYSLIQNKLENL